MLSSPADNIPGDDATGPRDSSAITADFPVYTNQEINTLAGTRFPVSQYSDQDTTMQPLEDWSYPMYFENIIMPQELQIDSGAPTQDIPDVARYMQDDDLWSNALDFSNFNNLDFFSANVFNFDASLTPNPEQLALNAANTQVHTADSPASVVSQNSLRARFDAFRRSPWYVASFNLHVECIINSN
jgi:hypothetical protein